eukprot:TRINITY_DN7805_c0_g1_i1.p1 TRINITY_DN7805_c0_g1~~TRINITY_DN7805_c0_g1_i1.p1  ORF type:complete len:1632 (-),score=395.44 TRINITY_DN7805_c0_g1_i1:701-5320(-)
MEIVPDVSDSISAELHDLVTRLQQRNCTNLRYELYVKLASRSTQEQASLFFADVTSYIVSVHNKDDTSGTMAVALDACRALLASHQHLHPQIAKLTDQLQSVVSSAGASDSALCHHCVRALAQLTIRANNSATTASVTQLLLHLHHTVAKPADELDTLIIDQLTDIALLLSQTPIHQQVVELFFTLYLHKRNLQVPAALFKLARGLRDNLELSGALLKRMLLLWVDVGMQLQSQPEGRRNLVQFASMLPVIAELLSHVPDSVQDETVAKLLRTVWFYCVLFRFVSDELAHDVALALTVIAVKTPPLAYDRSSQFLETALHFKRLLQIGNTEKEVPVLSKTLERAMPAHASAVRSLEAAQMMYLLVVYQLECMRTRSTGTFHTILVYLQAQGIEVEIVDAMIRHVADAVFALFVELLVDMGPCLAREQILAVQTQHLIVNICNRVPRVRECCDKFIKEVVGTKFHHVLWNLDCLRTLLDTVDAVGKSCTSSVGIVQTSVLLPGGRFRLNLPDLLSVRQQLVQLLVRLAQRWLKRAAINAPAETYALLQELGVWIAGNIVATPVLPGTTLNKQPFSITVERGAGPLLVYGAPAVEKTLHHVAHRLIAASELDTSLLLSLVHTPVQMWTRDSMIAAVHVWTWVLAARPELRPALMAEVARAWQWTIEERVGVFHKFTPSHDVSIADDHEPVLDSFTDPVPHRTWLVFLSEQYEVARSRSHIEIEALWQIVQRSITDDVRWSLHPLALGARFRFVQLALRMLHHFANAGGIEQLTSGLDGPTLALMLQRIYRSALWWFSGEMSWYQPANEQDAVEDVKVIKDVARILREDQHNSLHKTAETYDAWTVSADQISYDQASQPSRSTATASATVALRTLATARPASGVTATVPAKPSAYHNSLLLSDTMPSLKGFPTGDGSVPPSRDGVSVATGTSVVGFGGAGYALSARRALLLLLLEHELERLIAFHNPQGIQGLELYDVSVFSTDKIISIPQWQRHVETAWAVNPRIAIHMAIRFPIQPVKQHLMQRVLTNPLAVVGVPDAVPLLVTERNVELDIPELRHLLYWRPCSLATALSLLGRNFKCHPLVTRFAVRVLRSFRVETVIFFLPQLVQSLRWHPEHGVVEQFLLDVALSSEKAAHELTWVLKTEEAAPVADSKMFSPTSLEFAARCTALKERVVATLKGESRKRYDEQIVFFDSVTNIAGMLKVLEKPMRKAKIQEELRKVEAAHPLTPNIYFPTNPELRIEGIVYDSVASMQSATRTPVLIKFDVAEDKPDGSILRLQRAIIFKIGDECRQDMLALQMMRLCRRIFESANLPLFLYPYRVVPTGGEKGLIEVVPDARSRDQIGKDLEEGKNLYDYFRIVYGHPDSTEFQEIRRRFIESMAGYSVFCYIMQVKDRHNGNILLTREGRIVHIDFGFIFDHSPGGDMRFENAPFKLSKEMIQIMGLQRDSEHFRWFNELCIRGFLALRQHMDSLVALAELMEETKLPCYFPDTIKNLRMRFVPELSDRGAAQHMMQCINTSYDNWRTNLYDGFQELTQGIAH